MAKEVPLTRGFVALVDDADYERVAQFRWHADVQKRSVYARRNLERGAARTGERLHTFLTGWPRVDHADGDGLNNQRANLRPATVAENGQNRWKPAVQTTSQFKGVSWHKAGGKWMAQVVADGIRHYLGLFTSEVDAARAHDRAAREFCGEFAVVNFPEG